MRHLFLIVIFFPLTLHAAAWNLAEGKSLLITQIEKKHEEITTPDIDGKFIQASDSIFYKLHFEHGVTDKVTLGIIPTFSGLLSSVSYREDSRTFIKSDIYKNSGNGSPKFYSCKLQSRHSFVQENGHAVSIQPSIELYEKKLNEIELRGLYGYSWLYDKQYQFINFEAGYKTTSEYDHSAIHLDLTLGYRPNDDYLFLIESHNLLASKASQKLFKEYNKIQLSTVKKLSKTIHSQYGFYFTLGNKEYKSRGMILSLWFYL